MVALIAFAVNQTQGGVLLVVGVIRVCSLHKYPKLPKIQGSLPENVGLL